MSRQEKKTRIRVVPPKLQLRGQDALTGSYPTNVRFSLDGRTGNYKVGYNDVQTVVFETRSNGTSWQDNLVGYWTIQRSGPTNSAVGDLTFEGEISGSLGAGIYPYLDFNLAKPIASSDFLEIGITQSYGHYGKGYDVNLQHSSPVVPVEFPYLEPNKSYDFNPHFSAYGYLTAKATPKNSKYPLLVQNLDGDKSLFAFTQSYGSPPPKNTFQPFTAEGWFYFSSSNIDVINGSMLIAGPCRKSPWTYYNVDYLALARDDGSGNVYFTIFFIGASISTNAMYVETVAIPNIRGNWFHFAFTYDGRTKTSDPAPADNDTIKIYANGNRVPLNIGLTQVGSGFTGYDTGKSVQYGLSTTYVQALNSTVRAGVGEIALYDRVLTDYEVAETYYSQVPLHKKRRVIAGISIDLDNDPYPVDAGEYMTNFNRDGMLVTGSIVKGIGDNPEWVHFSPGQEMQPFHDQQQFAADAKGASVQNSFFATGSAETLVGEGFNSPLWSKNKIEIPIPVVADTVLKLPQGKFTTPDTVGLSYNSPMGYYNFEKNVWEPIGIGIEIDKSNLKMYQDYLTVGFFNGFAMTQSINPIIGAAGISQLHTMGYCGSDFGFPYHPKYHATSSQTLDMSQYITEPFVLEKAVLELGPISLAVGGVDLTRVKSAVSGSITTFFLLNQRKNQNVTYSKKQFSIQNGSAVYVDVSASIPADCYLTRDNAVSLTSTRVDTLRDIVGFSQIYSFASKSLDYVFERANIPGFLYSLTSSVRDLLPLTNNDILIEHKNVSTLSGVNYNNLLPVISMSMCTPPFLLKQHSTIGFTKLMTKYYPVTTYENSLYISFDGSRTGLNMTQLSTRGLNNDLFYSENFDKSPLFVSLGSVPTEFPTEKHKQNPYILYPQDKLIFGCQAPVSQNPAYTTLYASGEVNAECVLTLKESSGKNKPKLVLYGSYIRENKEYNDGTNQLLSSETIHEVIE